MCLSAINSRVVKTLASVYPFYIPFPCNFLFKFVHHYGLQYIIEYCMIFFIDINNKGTLGLTINYLNYHFFLFRDHPELKIPSYYVFYSINIVGINKHVTNTDSQIKYTYRIMGISKIQYSCNPTLINNKIVFINVSVNYTWKNVLH